MWLKEQNIQNHYKMLKDYRTNNLLSGQIKQPSDGITTHHISGYYLLITFVRAECDSALFQQSGA